MDHVDCMRMFVRVVELGSFARASEDFDVSRSVATQALARLENRVGVRLLHRTTRKLSPTEEGRAYYESCVRILDDMSEAEESLSGARLRPRGRLRVSTPHPLTHLVFFPQLKRFFERYPELELEVVVTDRAVNLVEEGIDCAIRGSPIADDSTLIARHVARVRWMTCASPAYLKARGTPRAIEELASHECIRFISPSTGRVSDWQFVGGGGTSTFTPRGRLGVTSLESAASAAQHGLGIAQVPEPLISAALREKAVRPLLAEHIAPAPSLHVVYPSNRHLSAKVRAFADFVAEIFPREVFR